MELTRNDFKIKPQGDITVVVLYLFKNQTSPNKPNHLRLDSDALSTKTSVGQTRSGDPTE